MSQYPTKSTLHVRIRNFVKWIAPEKETRDTIKKQSDEIRTKVIKKAEEDGFAIVGTPYAGSFPAKTGLRRHLRGESAVDGQDIDLPFVVKNDKETEFGPLIQRFKGYAEAAYPDTKVTTTKSSVNMEFTGTKLTYDLVPMFSAAQEGYEIIIRNNGDVITTSIQKHLEFIKKRTKLTKEEDGVVAFNDMIRLLKWWREHKQQATNEVITIPSFLVNILSSKALEKCNVQSNYPQTLANWFSYLAHIVKNKETVWFKDYYTSPTLDAAKSWQVFDPVMPENNIVKNWSNWQIDELADWLQEASEIMNRAIVADSQGRDADSLEQMRTLFGKIFSSHCD